MSQSPLESTYEIFMQGIYGSDCDAEAIVLPSQQQSAGECLDIYRSSVRGNLIQALGDIYPAIKRSVGEEFFDALASRFVSLYPSRSSSLDDYGEQFGEFIAEFPPLEDFPYMPDLALVEWAWHRAFHALDEGALDTSLLQSLSLEDQLTVRLVLNKSITLLKSPYPISKIWHMNRGFTALEEVDLSQGGEYLIVWRKEYETRVDVVEATDFTFLKQIKKGNSLGTIYEDLLSKGSNNEQLVSALTKSLSSGWLTGFKRE